MNHPETEARGRVPDNGLSVSRVDGAVLPAEQVQRYPTAALVKGADVSGDGYWKGRTLRLIPAKPNPKIGKSPQRKLIVEFDCSSESSGLHFPAKLAGRLPIHLGELMIEMGEVVESGSERNFSDREICLD